MVSNRGILFFMQEFDKVLTQGERIVWEGRPEFKPYYAYNIVPSILNPLLLAPLLILPFLWISYS